MTPAAGFGRTEARRFCAALGLPSVDHLSPAARVSAFPPGCCSELLATSHGVARLKAYMAEGSPAVTMDDLVQLRTAGSDRTRCLLAEALLKRPVAPAAVHHIIRHAAVMSIGSDAAGLTTAAPHSRYWRVILLNDRLEDEELVSTFLHEAAHHWLMVRPELDNVPLEYDGLLNSDAGFWLFAGKHNLVEDYLRRHIQREYQACALAKVWGATGSAIDGDLCSDVLRRELFTLRAERSLAAL